jgi:hypothetical protein
MPALKPVCDQVNEQLFWAEGVKPSSLVCALSNVTTYTPASGPWVEPRNTDPPCRAGETTELENV